MTIGLLEVDQSKKKNYAVVVQVYKAKELANRNDDVMIKRAA